MKYKSVIVTKRGGPEVLKVIENDLREPSAGAARIKILATPVVQDDVAVRKGNRSFLAKVLFAPGYSILGVVDATGAGVTDVAVGDRVAALTNFGGYSEYIYWDAEKLVQVPITLDPAEVVVLILNYLVAYQVLHRVVQVTPGGKVLIIGASGGVGTAFLQLGELAGLTRRYQSVQGGSVHSHRQGKPVERNSARSSLRTMTNATINCFRLERY